MIVRSEKARHDAGLASAAESRRRFDVPVFVFSRGSGLAQPADPGATLAAAEDSARSKGWIESSGRLDDRWYEIVSALVYGQSFGYLYLTAPDEPETRAMVAVGQGLAFRIVLRADRVRIDEVRPASADRRLVDCLPDAAPASGRPVLVPTEILTAAALEAENHKADQGDWIAYELGQAGVSTDDARTVGAFAKLADRRIGQFNVGIRDAMGRRHLAPWSITTHHCASGRVARIPQAPYGEQTLVGPAHDHLIAEALGDHRAKLEAPLGY
ncbi:ESX secretion-associated protein EspG [Saccharopolyspora taberi]|uniref:ESX secretion-associated protein EspG n=1 Tax=Saccharopolyspora taberi TaxID=60895 RepID=UPI0031E2D74A